MCQIFGNEIHSAWCRLAPIEVGFLFHRQGNVRPALDYSTVASFARNKSTGSRSSQYPMKRLPVRYPACFWAARDHFRTSSLVHHRCWFSCCPISWDWEGEAFTEENQQQDLRGHRAQTSGRMNERQ